MAARTVVKTCSICLGDLKDPRLLPCIHTYCLECLEQYCRRQLPGDEVRCPECRRWFEIPQNGVAGLTVRTHCNETDPTEWCEACDKNCMPAAVYCLVCSQKLCHSCSVPHKEMKCVPHDVRPLHEVTVLSGGPGSNCEEHKQCRRMYCFECKTTECSRCYFEKHRAHDFDRVEKVLEQFTRAIDEAISSRIQCYSGAIDQVEIENRKLMDNMRSMKEEVRARSAQIKQLIDRQEKELLRKIDAFQSSALRAARCRIDAMHLASGEMDAFKTSPMQVHLDSLSTDLVQGAEDAHLRAKEMLQAHAIPDEYRAPSFTFTRVDIEKVLGYGQNLIGQVVEDAADTAAARRTVDQGHRARLCHLRKWRGCPVYGISVRSRVEHCISAVSTHSPAEAVGLRVGDRIVEVNGRNMEHSVHHETVERMMAVQGDVRLLVVDPDADKYFRQKNITVTDTMDCVDPISTPGPHMLQRDSASALLLTLYRTLAAP